MDASGPVNAPRSEPSPGGVLASYGIVGVLAGPVLGLLFTFARIGPAGLIWWQGKGGETILTPLGRTIVSVIMIVGAVAGALGVLALEARYRTEIAAGKPKSDAPPERLWDRELVG